MKVHKLCESADPETTMSIHMCTKLPHVTVNHIGCEFEMIAKSRNEKQQNIYYNELRNQILIIMNGHNNEY